MTTPITTPTASTVTKDRFKAAQSSSGLDLTFNKDAMRRDLYAMNLLDRLFPRQVHYRMVIAASNNRIWLDVSAEQIETLTDDQVLELVKCGVFYDSATGRLSMSF